MWRGRHPRLHVSVEHPFTARRRHDALVHLVRLALLVAQVHRGVQVQALPGAREVKARQLGDGSRPELLDAQVVSPQNPAEVHLSVVTGTR